MENYRMPIVLCILAVVFYIGHPIVEKLTQYPESKLIDTNQSPLQESVEEESIIMDIDGEEYVVEPMATYEIYAQVLSKKKYRFDTFAKLSPYDLALGWGPVLEPELMAKVKYTQRNRWYYYYYGDLDEIGKSVKDISANSANTHVMASNYIVLKGLKKVKEGDVIEMKGYLVSITGKDFNADSSLSRTDSGAGACEILYVTYLLSPDGVFE